MIKQPYILNCGFCILLLLAFLQACSSSPGTVQSPSVQNGETKIVPTNTPFQPSIVTPTYTLEAVTMTSATSEAALTSLTNPSDVTSPGSVTATQASGNTTAIPPTQPASNSTTPPQVETPSVPTNSPDIPTPPPPPGEPSSVPTNTPDIGTAPPPGDPRIQVVPKIGPIPTTYTLKIENFDQGEQVTIQIISKTTRVIIDSFVVIVDGKGGLVTSWTSRADYDIGGYLVKAIGANHGKPAIGELEIQ